MPVSKLAIGITSIAAAALGLGAYVHQRGGPAAASATPRVSTLGYLAASDIPNSVTLLPPPPAEGSKAMAADESARTAALRLGGTPRYALAATDAVRTAANTVQGFVCALGTDISSERTPALFALLSRVRLDVRAASYPAKSHYLRARPFVVHKTHSCYTDDEAMVHEDGSYPSARGAVGWAYALVLAEVAPERKDALMARGSAFGESRVVCDQEWQSDVDAGRLLATETVRRMQSSEAFRADVAKARREVQAELARGVKPARNCASESAALASR